MWFWIVLGVIFLVFLLLFLTPLRILLTYQRVGENDRLSVEVQIWYRLIKLKYEIPLVKLKWGQSGPKWAGEIKKGNRPDQEIRKAELDTPKIKKSMRTFQWFKTHVIDFLPILKDLMLHIRCEQLNWRTAIGVGDAAATGTLTGMVFGIKSAVIGAISHHISLTNIPRISVHPVWNGEIIRTNLTCILRFQVGHAIIAGVRILLKLRKGRERTWQSTQSKA